MYMEDIKMWETYSNLNGKSGIIKYQINLDSIDVMFKTGSIYTYPDYKIGRNHLETMFSLARQGRGLHTYIMTHEVVKKGYVQ